MHPRLLIFGLLFLISFEVIWLTRNQTLPCANSKTCANNLETLVENGKQGIFLRQAIWPPEISENNLINPILGDTSDSANKHIYIDLDSQTLYAYEDNKLFLQTLVSTGLWGRTPAGEYQIWLKVRSTRMAGGSGNDAYDLPNVPYNMFFYNSQVSKDRGYALHGAYWHNNFGNKMSHGCVNLREVDAKKLYDWVNPATTKPTTYASSDDPGTIISICNKIEFQAEIPICLE